jgi:hypothetical protein
LLVIHAGDLRLARSPQIRHPERSEAQSKDLPPRRQLHNARRLSNLDLTGFKIIAARLEKMS